jgi:hypothetical protein
MLVTVARAQQADNLAGIDATWLMSLIEAASTAIEAWLRRTFTSTAYTEKYDGNNEIVLFLKKYPLTKLTAVVVTDQASDTDYTFDSDDFYTRAVAGELRFKATVSGQVNYFLAGFQNVEVQYTAGFAEIPADVQEAVVQLVQHSVSRGENDAGMESEKFGDYQYKRARTDMEDIGLWPNTIRRLVAHYKEHLA